VVVRHAKNGGRGDVGEPTDARRRCRFQQTAGVFDLNVKDMFGGAQRNGGGAMHHDIDAPGGPGVAGRFTDATLKVRDARRLRKIEARDVDAAHLVPALR